MKCSCGSRFYKSVDEGVVFFFRRLLIRKSDQQLVVFCNNCGNPTVATPELADLMKSAVLLQAQPLTKAMKPGQSRVRPAASRL